MRTFYMAEGSNAVYTNPEECRAEEERRKNQQEEWKIRFDSYAKLEKLKTELDEAMLIAPGTIATCTANSLQIKALVRTCQKFVEENKDYLRYY